MNQSAEEPGKRVSVFGVGYVGCVTAACLARDGHRVIGVDVDEDKVDQINSGVSPVSEPGLEELLAEQVREKRLDATTDGAQAVRETEIALVAVGTPSSADGSVSLSALENVTRLIGTTLKDCDHPFTIVIRSTLLPGILEDHLIPILCETSGRQLGPELRVCNNPEFLRESTAIADYDDPPYVVFGVPDDWDAEPVQALYEKIDTRCFVVNSRSAAMIKYTCNAFHALKVAFANEVGSLARQFGANGAEVMSLVCEDDKL
ncbi:MAG: nucleotide sugar dehydrogenase, partial [Planctomycetota bacterium]